MLCRSLFKQIFGNIYNPVISFLVLLVSILVGIIHVSSKCCPGALLDPTELAEVLHPLQVAGLHVLHQVALGVHSPTLSALPTTLHFYNVGTDQV